jgi:sortase (surface protein transpeptidase)
MRARFTALLIVGLALAVPVAGSAAGPSPGQRSPEQARILIPAIAVYATVGTDLMRGPAWWPQSTRPDRHGVVAIAAHDVTPVPGFGWHGPFRFIYRLRPGNRITLVWHRVRYEYVMTGRRVLPDTYLYPFPVDGDWLVLSTCWPAGSAVNRMYVYARRAS